MSKSKKPKVTPIKPSLTFVRAKPADLYTFGSSVYAGMNNNPAYPNPPVDMPTLKAALDGYNTLLAAALDGSKKVLSQRNHQGGVLIKILRQLAHYVETGCKDDMTIFTSSGFQPVPKAATKTPPLSQSIRKIKEGSKSGQLLVSLVAVKGALSYELRWAPAVMGATAPATTPTWTSTLVASTHPPTTVSNLTPGTLYQFEVRVLSKTGWADWNGPATRMAI